MEKIWQKDIISPVNIMNISRGWSQKCCCCYRWTNRKSWCYQLWHRSHRSSWVRVPGHSQLPGDQCRAHLKWEHFRRDSGYSRIFCSCICGAGLTKIGGRRGAFYNKLPLENIENNLENVFYQKNIQDLPLGHLWRMSLVIVNQTMVVANPAMILSMKWLRRSGWGSQMFICDMMGEILWDTISGAVSDCHKLTW